MSEQTKQNSNGSWPTWRDEVWFQLGFQRAWLERLQMQVDDLDETVAAPQVEASGPWTRAWQKVEKLHKVITIMRAIRWGSLAWSMHSGLRWLGVI